jgi:hypothetical protein
MKLFFMNYIRIPYSALPTWSCRQGNFSVCGWVSQEQNGFMLTGEGAAKFMLRVKVEIYEHVLHAGVVPCEVIGMRMQDGSIGVIALYHLGEEVTVQEWDQLHEKIGRSLWSERGVLRRARQQI